MDNLATELIKELRATSKRWFIVAVVELAIIVIITGIFIWYINQPVEETVETIEYTQDADTEGDNSPIV